jgi:hypothetical protein
LSDAGRCDLSHEGVVHFREVQRFRQWWLWLLMVPVVAALGLVAGSHLTTEVRDGALTVRYVPLTSERIELDRLRSFEARSYDPLREFGGWGLRGNARNGAYNATGRRGVQLVFIDGRRLLIGSQRAEELEAALRNRSPFRETQFLWQAGGWWLLVVVGAFGGGVVCLLLFSRLVTEVRDDGLHARFYPFHLRWVRIPWETVRVAQARTYRPILEYGGWGIRYGFGKSGKAYNVFGNRGVQLELTDGKRLLIGSQQADELEAAMRPYLTRRAR